MRVYQLCSDTVIGILVGIPAVLQGDSLVDLYKTLELSSGF